MSEPDFIVFGLLGAATFSFVILTWALVDRICRALDDWKETQNVIYKIILEIDRNTENILKTLGAWIDE